MARLGKRERIAFAAFKKNVAMLEAERQVRVAAEPTASVIDTNWQVIDRFHFKNQKSRPLKWEYDWKAARRINSGGKW
jgi:hypothetical protein